MAIGIDFVPSVQLSRVAESEKHGENSPYFAGWKAYDEDPYHEVENPSGVIQMGLAENQVGEPFKPKGTPSPPPQKKSIYSHSAAFLRPF